MAIDQSPLTFIIYLIFIAVVTLTNYKNKKNLIYIFVAIIWAISICGIFSDSILPIQFTNTGFTIESFKEQFSIMSLPQFKKYFIAYSLSNITYVTNFFMFSFTSYFLYKRMRKMLVASLVLLLLMSIHLVYNLFLNTLIDEIVKYINFEDFVLMSLGFIIGWFGAKILDILVPKLKNSINGFQK